MEKFKQKWQNYKIHLEWTGLLHSSRACPADIIIMNNHEIPPHGQINITLEDNHSDNLKETAYFIHPYRTPLGKNLYPYFFGSLHNCFYLSCKKKKKQRSWKYKHLFSTIWRTWYTVILWVFKDYKLLEEKPCISFLTFLSKV